jgi:hypothetical protein
MLPKTGIILPTSENLGSYSKAIAYALRSELGATHQAVKIIMRWTGAGERTVKNWLAGISGPSGEHLVALIRNSDNVLRVLLAMAGRPHTLAAQLIGDLRSHLVQTLDHIDRLMAEK